jgi:hypothetical protein
MRITHVLDRARWPLQPGRVAGLDESAKRPQGRVSGPGAGLAAGSLREHYLRGVVVRGTLAIMRGSLLVLPSPGPSQRTVQPGNGEDRDGSNS